MRRKRVLELAKGFFGRKKNVWTVAKNAVEKGLVYAYRDRKGWCMPTAIVRQRKGISVRCGSSVSTPGQDYTGCRTPSLWERSRKAASTSTAKYWPTWR